MIILRRWRRRNKIDDSAGRRPGDVAQAGRNSRHFSTAELAAWAFVRRAHGALARSCRWQSPSAAYREIADNYRAKSKTSTGKAARWHKLRRGKMAATE